ncbi:putative abieta-7,13-dien-18-ol hydroxylase [Rosa chinensis]|uniref:Putative abieta-7,13-dien-18-ol hydroxylase n=2 Tax=Rosa chinensis TaxID=74649 RepID=A0A2P6RRB3_ROSCH|nr:cytochrome P450 704C1 isoform X1 [Rosa chinensis]PRQ48963.1 putative abieta-7,13-dien-18-ol hydroxylase [Rosa chinensis]
MDFLSTPLPPIAIGLFAVLVLAVIFLRKKNKKYPPVAGTVIHQLINVPRLHHYMTELACKYKTYRMLDLFRYAVYTVDPANVEYILKTNFANYGKGLYLYNILSDVLGDGIVAVDGEKWRHQRKAASSQFSTKVLRDFSSEILKTNAVKLAMIISEAVTRDAAIEIQDLFTKATFDSIVKVLLGIDLDTMCGINNEESIQFAKAYERATEAVLYRIADISWRIKRFLNIGREAVIRNNMKVVDQFLYKLVNSKIETVGNSEDEPSLKKRDFISRLLETREADPKYLRDMVLFFIIGGKDTTASGLSWFLYMMCKHLQIQEKIAQEVREATGLNNTSSADEIAANLTEESLNKMQYLHASLTETLRLYPAVPMDARVCFSDDTLPDGFSIKKGELVVYQAYAMGRMKFLWGDDAEEFRPDRWLDENGIFQEESPFKFTAFHAGPRICLGKKYGYMQMKIFSAVLLGCYKFEMSDEKKDVNYKTMMTLHIDGGLHVNASPRV